MIVIVIKQEQTCKLVYSSLFPSVFSTSFHNFLIIPLLRTFHAPSTTISVTSAVAKTLAREKVLRRSQVCNLEEEVDGVVEDITKYRLKKDC